MPLSTRTCNEVRADAERNRRAVLANLAGLDEKAAKAALDKADAELKRADEREDCI